MGTSKKNLDSIPQKNRVMLSTAGVTEKGNWVSEDILRSAVEIRTEAARSKTWSCRGKTGWHICVAVACPVLGRSECMGFEGEFVDVMNVSWGDD